MGILKAFQRILGRRSSDDDERQWTGLAPADSSTGLSVNPDTAMRVAAVYACVTVLAESIASLPLILYRRDGERRSRETKHPLYKILHNKPNRWQTSFEFREMLMGHVLLRGNGYARKVYTKRGAIEELVPLNPTRVQPKMTPEGVVFYEFSPSRGGVEIIANEDMFHLKGYSPDGIIGTSPIAHVKEAVALALVSEEFGAKTFANDAQPGGVLQHPGNLGEKGLQNLRDSWNRHHSGPKNARSPLILEQGMTFQKVGMTSEDTQWIETRKFQIEEIARIFRVPPHLIGDLSRATFSNIEHQSLNFVQHTLLPWFRRWEQAIQERLFMESEQENLYVEFLADGLLRGDLQSRYNAYSIGRQWGWLSPNDVRRIENMEPLSKEEGDDYLVPMNMMPASRLNELVDSQMANNNKPTDNTMTPDPAKEPPAQPLNNQSRANLGVFEAFQPVLEHLLTRYDGRIAKSKRSFLEQRELIVEGLKPVVEGIFHLLSTNNVEVRAKIVLESFINYWNEAQQSPVEERIARMYQVIGDISEIKVVTAKIEQNSAPIINLSVTQPEEKAKPTKEMEVVWVNKADGERTARIREVKNA